MKKIFALFLLLFGCARTWHVPDDFIIQDITAPDYTIRTYQKLTSATHPIHIYIEGDGHAFNSRGIPTHNPTPRGTFMRELAAQDLHPNVAYIARPCQYNMSENCTQSDWTDGRFSQKIIDNITYVIQTVSDNRPIILVGYSGGALLSGLIITQHPEINVTQWITIAGVLNHNDWTHYFGDKPLIKSIDMDSIPTLPQTHYIADQDDIVPYQLSKKWTTGKNLITISNATHSNFPNIKINFNTY